MNIVHSLLSLLRLCISERRSSSLSFSSSSSMLPSQSALTDVSVDPFEGALGLAVVANIASFSPRH